LFKEQPNENCRTEEHFNIPHLVARIPRDVIRERGFPSPDQTPQTKALPQSKLKELGSARIAEMDAAGVSVQVVSVSDPGADLLPPAEGILWAKEANDHLAEAIRQYPKRYAGFAHLPTTAPDPASDELERDVRSLGFVGALILRRLVASFREAVT
jgi:predicted TIM-barrel fold metal-dependent hydrolase